MECWFCGLSIEDGPQMRLPYDVPAKRCPECDVLIPMDGPAWRRRYGRLSDEGPTIRQMTAIMRAMPDAEIVRAPAHYWSMVEMFIDEEWPEVAARVRKIERVPEGESGWLKRKSWRQIPGKHRIVPIRRLFQLAATMDTQRG
jgi:hypothetical protein